MHRARSVFVVASWAGLLSASAACVSTNAAGGSPERAQAVVEPPSPRPTAASGVREDWTRIGAVLADGIQDRDTLVLSAPGRERLDEAIRLKAVDGRIELYEVVVEYEDGAREVLKAPRILEEGESVSAGPISRVRPLRALHFRYSELRRGGPGARIEVFAR